MDFIKFLIGVVLAGLVLYFLWWLFNQRFRSSNHNEGQRNATNDSLHNYQPNITVVVEITQTNPAASSNFEKDAMEHHLNVIKEMQKSGGHTDFSLNNFSFHVDVPTSTENKNEKAGTDTATKPN